MKETTGTYIVTLRLPVGVAAQENTRLAGAIEESNHISDELRRVIIDNAKDMLAQFYLEELEPQIEKIKTEEPPTRYSVVVCRTAYSHQTFYVEAEDVGRVSDLAISQAMDSSDWRESSSEYEVISISKV